MEFVNGPWPQLLDFLVNSKEAIWATIGAVLTWIFRRQVQACCIHGHHGRAAVLRPMARPVALLVVACLFAAIPAFPLLTYPGLLNKAVLLSGGVAGCIYVWHTFSPLAEWHSDKLQGLAVVLLVWAIGFGGIGFAGVWYH